MLSSAMLSYAQQYLSASSPRWTPHTHHTYIHTWAEKTHPHIPTYEHTSTQTDYSQHAEGSMTRKYMSGRNGSKPTSSAATCVCLSLLRIANAAFTEGPSWSTVCVFVCVCVLSSGHDVYLVGARSSSAAGGLARFNSISSLSTVSGDEKRSGWMGICRSWGVVSMMPCCCLSRKSSSSTSPPNSSDRNCSSRLPAFSLI
mmetsp:Transcript_4533/g.12022  ORF Transcript_4533/g.12022 Transcript_4533/m.12022 type:complete len:200 (+) Transcript_4533:1665-2264(+)